MASSSAPKDSSKDAVTCHVLDTTVGRPAKGMRVRLEIEGNSLGSAASTTAVAVAAAANMTTTTPATFESHTDDDGRVRTWLPYSSATSGEVPVYTLDDVLGAAAGPSRCTLRFDTEGYFGCDDTFFPEAVVVFRVHKGQHYHVPLLLSPYSYTTYRGS